MSEDRPGQAPAEFGRLRSFFWPIHRYELGKLLPMFLMFFFISLVYSLLRNTKDTLIVTAPGGGAGLIPFLKVYGTIPGSILAMVAYSRVVGRLGKGRAFYLTIGVFMAFFLAFGFLFPIRERLEPAAWAAALEGRLSPGLGHLVATFRHWVLSLFYVMAELWGSMALSLLFWGLANDITRVEESKRYYALFGLGANLALVAVKGVNHGLRSAGQVLAARCGIPAWDGYLYALIGVVLVSGLLIMALYHRVKRVVRSDPRFAAAVDPASFRKRQVPLRESLPVLLKSTYLRYIAILVLAYGIAINLIEVTWKHQLGLAYPQPGRYQDFMANFSLATGCVTLFLMLFVSSNVIRRFGWTTAALATPVVLLVTGMGFFGVLLWPVWFRAGALAVPIGAVQNVLSKASKYALFDPTKEMAYIPLDQEAKVKGKAGIDVVGARFGKAGGSLILQVLIGMSGSLDAVTGPIAGILLLVIGAWIWAGAGLGRAFARRSSPAGAQGS